MTLGELFPILHQCNIRLWVQDGHLRYGAPPGALTPPLRAALLAHRETLLEVLGPRAPAPSDAQPSAHRESPSTTSSDWRDPAAHDVGFVEVGPGLRLEVLDYGGRGPAMMFLHGLGNTAHVFDELAPVFRDRHQVFALTRRGFGASSHAPGGYDPATLSHDVLAVLDALGVERAILVGHSIAGEELSWLAARRPDRVAALVYLDAAYDRRSSPVRLGQRDATPASAPRSADLASPVAYARFWKATFGFSMPLGEVLAGHVFAPSGKLLRPAAARDANRLIAEAAVRPDYERIEAPALALFAVPAARGSMTDLDGRAARVANARVEFASRVKHGRSVAIHGADHYVFLSHAEIVADEIRRFLDGVAGPRADGATQLHPGP